MRERWSCHYCSIELGLIGNPFGLPEMTRDHIVPRARGGRDIGWNIQISCAECNVLKSDIFPTCSCGKCRRSRRRHWEFYRIREDTPRPTPRDQARFAEIDESFS